MISSKTSSRHCAQLYEIRFQFRVVSCSTGQLFFTLLFLPFLLRLVQAIHAHVI